MPWGKITVYFITGLACLGVMYAGSYLTVWMFNTLLGLAPQYTWQRLLAAFLINLTFASAGGFYHRK